MSDHSSHPIPSTRGAVLPVGLAIAVATAPLLVALVGARVLASTAQNLGHWSEELFRGDRLPTINQPHPPTPNTSSPD